MAENTRIHILVVDDDRGILELVRRSLEHEGYQVDTIENSKAVLEQNLVFHPLINSTFWRAMYQQLFLLIHQCHQDCISNGTQSVLHLFLQNICRYDS